MDAGRPSWLTLLASHLGALFLVLFGAVVAVAIIYGLFSNARFFTSIAESGQARGLITFLFAFSTIAIILLVAVATFWMPKDDVQLRFDKAKDLLTIIIGVLGTILGFYFGSASPTDRQPPAPLPPAQAGAPAQPSSGEAAR
jgi:nicotinamide riboside transporter PnuC